MSFAQIYNWVGTLEQIIESTDQITTSHQILSATFEREGDTVPAEGTLTLHHLERRADRAGWTV